MTPRIQALLIFCAIAVSSAVHATPIRVDFTGETAGPKADGYAVGGIQFFSTSGHDLQVLDFGVQSDGLAIASSSDEGASALRMRFSGVYDYLAFDFGNDDPGAGYEWGVEANAMLRLYRGGTQVAELRMDPNGDDIMNQTFLTSGIQFDEALFWYMLPHSTVQGVRCAEIIDNIVYSNGPPVAVPEPNTSALFALGLLGAMWFRRRAQRVN